MKNKFCVLTLIFSILLSVLPLTAQTDRKLEREKPNAQIEKRIALIIGNGAYTKAKPLPNPSNDAADMTASLKTLGFEVLSGVNLDKRGMENLIRDFGNKLANGGVGLFYYAGHGIQVGGENYLVPVDADIPEEDEVSYSAVPVNLVLRKMATAGNTLNIVILDACRNNPFARSWRTFRDNANADGLAKIAPPTGTLVLYATEPGKVASDGAGRNGLFTESLLKQIKKPNVEYDQMVKALSADVWQKSNKQQLPWKEGNSLSDFYFAKTKIRTASPTTAEPIKDETLTEKDRATVEREAWSYIKNSTDAQDFRDFLKEFSDGANAANARIKLEQAVWDLVKDSKVKAKIQAYLNEFQTGANAPLARIKLRQLDAPTTNASNNNSQKSKTDKTKGSFTGKVVDSQSGFAISGAVVQFINQHKNSQTAVRTDSEGTIFSTALSPGIYLIRISLQGYKTFSESQELFATRINAIIPVPIKLERLTTLDETKPTTTNTTNTTSATKNVGAISKSTLPNGVEMSFVYIPEGSFQMGSTNGSDDEKPVHKVTISQGFYMQTTEATQTQWEAVMGNNPSNFKNCANCPVETISWDDAQSFIAKLNAQNDGFKYRLPSEAEWEYTARARTTGDYAGNLDSMTWYSANSGSKTHEVGTKQANAWGLYDMHGNVWEWVQDWYSDSYYASSPSINPTGATSGSYRVFRGGSWGNDAVNLRSAGRSYFTPPTRGSILGFRVVRQ